MATEPADIESAARMLRMVLADLPASTPLERATARRIEGAAVALDAIAERWPAPENDRP
jgi:hypothetical protein